MAVTSLESTFPSLWNSGVAIIHILETMKQKTKNIWSLPYTNRTGKFESESKPMGYGYKTGYL